MVCQPSVCVEAFSPRHFLEIEQPVYYVTLGRFPCIPSPSTMSRITALCSLAKFGLPLDLRQRIFSKAFPSRLVVGEWIQAQRKPLFSSAGLAEDIDSTLASLAASDLLVLSFGKMSAKDRKWAHMRAESLGFSSVSGIGYPQAKPLTVTKSPHWVFDPSRETPVADPLHWTAEVACFHVRPATKTCIAQNFRSRSKSQT